MDRRRKNFVTVWHLGTMGLMALALILVLSACGLKEMTDELTKHRNSADYAALAEALSARWNPDDTIPTASMGFDYHSSGGENEIWFTIEVSSTATCNDTSADACERLADELAAIVFENYGLVDELNGIRVVIGSEPHDLNVEASDVMLAKSLSIAEWREALGIE
jgi:hypothetical protein